MNTKKQREEAIFIKQNHPYADLVLKINTFRYKYGVTNQSLADRAGLSRAKVAAFITGARVDKQTADKLAMAIETYTKSVEQ